MNSNDAMDLGTMTMKKSNTVNDTYVLFKFKDIIDNIMKD